MIYDVCLETSDGRTYGNNYVTVEDNPALVEDEITEDDYYVVSNSRKFIRVKRADVVALTIEFKEN